MKALVFAILLALILPNLCADSVLLKSNAEMIAGADFISIVEFQSETRGIFKGQAAYPRQKERIMKRFSRCVSARVIENLKGKLPEQIQIYDGSGRWDALFQNHIDRENSNSGRYLIFLTGDVDFLTGANGGASTGRISGEEIEWRENANSPKFQMINFKEILDRIRKQIEIK